MLQKVISGAQTGADRAGLDAAGHCGLARGGYMPAGFIAHDGQHPDFARIYGISATKSAKYPPRTELNVTNSDATIQFATNWGSPGERLTSRLVAKHSKPSLKINPSRDVDVQDIVDWILDNNITILNVAGNSERTSPGIYDATYDILVTAFTELSRHP